MEIGSPPPASAMTTTAANVGGGDNHAAEETPASLTVFRYEKSLLSRLHECKDVLKTAERTVPASKVREQWRYFIEMQVEPAGRIELRIFNFQFKYGFLYIYICSDYMYAGWQAFWRIPRVICESLKISYPSVVFGMVEQVLFADLKATFRVTDVQDDNVHLPGRHEVELVDLLPTKFQENDAINIETTAACVDMLR